MNSSPNPPAERDPPLASEAGLERIPGRVRDPLLRWIELMEVVEALCPRWPERRWRENGDFRI